MRYAMHTGTTYPEMSGKRDGVHRSPIKEYLRYEAYLDGYQAGFRVRKAKELDVLPEDLYVEMFEPQFYIRPPMG